ncbi:prolipoprotein diacylglyceryl transferase, partial [Candidatus Parcubacteria bacterium]
MIPYIEWTTIQLGPAKIYVWGLMVAIGVFIALIISLHCARKLGLKPDILEDAAVWILAGAIIGARIFHIVFYDPGFYWHNPSEILKIWQGGMSIFGGLFFGVAFGVYALRQERKNLLKYADAVAYGMPWGIFIGRIGCFLIHDHPGLETNFFLGVMYPDGIVRHDLGLYLSIFGLLTGILFLILNRKDRFAGFYSGMFLVLYGLSRLILDS